MVCFAWACTFTGKDEIVPYAFTLGDDAGKLMHGARATLHGARATLHGAV